MHSACVATKTISIDLEAYRRLSRARRNPKESLSRVIKRALWSEEDKTCKHLLENLGKTDILDSETLDRLEAGQQSDAPPPSKWTD